MNPNPSIAHRVGALTRQQRVWLAAQLNASMKHESNPTQNELVAWVVTELNTVDESELRCELQRRLPASLIPRRIVAVESIPRTITGKIDRQQLARRPKIERRVVPVDEHRWTKTERTLIDVCRGLLGVNSIVPQNNFFHIGGDSLLSIRLISVARQRGLAIEPRDVLESNSIAELAAASDRRSGDRMPDKAETAAAAVITKIRSGRHAGSILLVHEVGGRCHYAHYLAAQLAPEQTLFVSNQPPPDESPQTLQTLASLYLDAWVDAQPDGPRIIVCFCWGGLLGYEIARQTKLRGIELDALLVVESGTEAAYDHAPVLNRTIDRMKGTWVRVRNRTRLLHSRQAFADLAKTLTSKLLQRRADPITADAGFQFRDDEGDPAQIRANVQAFLDYQPQPDSLPLHLFRVEGPTGLIGTRYSDRSLGWRYVVGDQLMLHTIPGTHDTCMQPPHVDRLAAAMNRVINQLMTNSRT